MERGTLKNRTISAIKVCALLLIALLVVGVFLTEIVHADNTNLAPMSATGTVTFDANGYPYDGVWELTHGVPPTGPTLIHVDTNVTYNGDASIRLDPYTPNTMNPARECDADGIKINPGDNIVLSCWMKTTASEYGPSDGGGARISFDYYDNFGIINLTQPDLSTLLGWGTQNTYVPWGSDWTERTIDVQVPSSIIDSNGTTRYPTLMVPWIQVWGSTLGDPATNTGEAWFADAELYINPSATIEPTSSPTPSPGSSGNANSIAGIALANVTSSQSFVEQSFNATLTANVENAGNATDNFFVTFAVNNIPVSTQSVTLANGSSTTVSCVWNTAGFALGDYVLSAIAWPVPGEASASSDVCKGSTVLVTYLGDLTGQGSVDSFSIFAFVNAYISYNTKLEYNPNADFQHNGNITAVDFADFVSAYIAYWNGPAQFVRNGQLTLTVSALQAQYNIGVPVNFTLSISNVSNKTISFSYTGDLFDYIVYNNTGIVYRYSLSGPSPMFTNEISLSPYESLTEEFGWNQSYNLNSLSAVPCILDPSTSNQVSYVTAGTYYVVCEALGMGTFPWRITTSATTGPPLPTSTPMPAPT